MRRLTVITCCVWGLTACSSDTTETGSDAAPDGVTVEAIDGQACRLGAPAPGIFTESREALGITFTYNPEPPFDDGNNRLEDFSGVGIGDLDGDGALDLYFSGGGNPDELYLTAGQGPATYRRELRGGGEDDRSRVVTLADLEGDGDLDAVIGADSPYVIRNDGSGRFDLPTFFPHEVATPETLYNVYGFAVGDIDGDSQLDVLVAVHEEFVDGQLLPGAEWLQRGVTGGEFEDAGLPPQGFEDKTFLAMLVDLDGDGDLDVYEVNDAWSPSELGQGGSEEQIGNRLLRNDGTGRFEDVTAGSGAELVVSAMGGAVGDYDNDGLLDLYVTAMTPDTNTLLRNMGGLRFEDVTFESDADTLYDEHDVGWGAEFFDADSDGWLDLYVLHGWHTTGTFAHNVPANADAQRNVLLLNRGDGTFGHDFEASGLQGDAWSRSPALGDLNGDGFVDVVVGNAKGHPYVYLNGCDDRPWLTVRLEQASSANRYGVGARITATAGGVTQTRVIMAGGRGLFGSSAPEAYFGFPPGTTSVELKVVWSDGVESSVPEAPTRKLLKISR